MPVVLDQVLIPFKANYVFATEKNDRKALHGGLQYLSDH